MQASSEAEGNQNDISVSKSPKITATVSPSPTKPEPNTPAADASVDPSPTPLAANTPTVLPVSITPSPYSTAADVSYTEPMPSKSVTNGDTYYPEQIFLSENFNDATKVYSPIDHDYNLQLKEEKSIGGAASVFTDTWLQELNYQYNKCLNNIPGEYKDKFVKSQSSWKAYIDGDVYNGVSGDEAYGDSNRWYLIHMDIIRARTIEIMRIEYLCGMQVGFSYQSAEDAPDVQSVADTADGNAPDAPAAGNPAEAPPSYQLSNTYYPEFWPEDLLIDPVKIYSPIDHDYNLRMADEDFIGDAASEFTDIWLKELYYQYNKCLEGLSEKNKTAFQNTQSSWQEYLDNDVFNEIGGAKGWGYIREWYLLHMDKIRERTIEIMRMERLLGSVAFRNQSTTDGPIAPVSREKAGLAEVTPLDNGNIQINTRIGELLDYDRDHTFTEFQDFYSDKDYADGLACQYSGAVIVSSRYKNTIVTIEGEAIQIGSDMDDIQKLLGGPQIKEPDITADDQTKNRFLLYLTDGYYIGFIGGDTVKAAVLYPTVDTTIDMQQLLTDFKDGSQGFSDDHGLLWNQGHIMGGGHYAYTKANAIRISEFNGENVITVFNNYRGELYAYTGESYFTVQFSDIDNLAVTISSAVDSYYLELRQFETEGVSSPDDVYSFIRLWFTSDDHYTVVRRKDYSKKDLITLNANFDDPLVWFNNKYLYYASDVLNEGIILLNVEKNNDYIYPLAQFDINDKISDYDYQNPEITATQLILCGKEDKSRKLIFNYTVDNEGQVEFNSYSIME